MLTERQAAVLHCIREFARRGENPRISEIGHVVGIGQTTVHHHLKSLERMGYLLPRPKWRHRGIMLAEPLKSAA